MPNSENRNSKLILNDFGEWKCHCECIALRGDSQNQSESHRLRERTLWLDVQNLNQNISSHDRFGIGNLMTVTFDKALKHWNDFVLTNLKSLKTHNLFIREKEKMFPQIFLWVKRCTLIYSLKLKSKRSQIIWKRVILLIGYLLMFINV